MKGLIGNIKSIEFSVVEELPTSGDKATIYLISNDKGAFTVNICAFLMFIK
ncbi:hypothetical protein J2S20_001413 [Moryella indoligenes]|uniref:Uncharacterized protein n=1 Tax=Moryella indoligenes TaxID=371674 RepID=A0AAE3VAJ5_9FIRM|nr:hypothetical protein [Moryella indoligenes]